jgi:alkylation response protein AidB-like acyl-CoA dehydrogenase
MYFDPTDDQLALQEAVRAVCVGRYPVEVLHEMEAAGGGVDRARWTDLADLGIFSLREDGMAMADAALVFEVLGAHLVPGPLVSTHLSAGLVDGAANGLVIVGVIEPAEPITVLEHVGSIDQAVVVRESGLELVAPGALEASAPVERPLDANVPASVVRTIGSGITIGDAAAAARWRRDGAVLTAAYLVGMARVTVDLATEYAKGREQFGRPIGSFQAVKHMIADMLVRAEVARAAVHAAAVTIDQPDVGDVDRAVAGAKLLAGEAALFCAKTCIQVHGGMGFTWEVDAQRYWKRACVLDLHYGGAEIHGEAVAATL